MSFEIETKSSFRRALAHIGTITVTVTQPKGQNATVSWDAPLSGRDAKTTRVIAECLVDASSLADKWTDEGF